MHDPLQTRKLTIEDLGISEIELGPTEVVEGAILVLRTVAMDENGRHIGLTIATSAGLDFMIRRGMVELLHDDTLAGEDEDEEEIP